MKTQQGLLECQKIIEKYNKIEIDIKNIDEFIKDQKIKLIASSIPENIIIKIFLFLPIKKCWYLCNTLNKSLKNKINVYIKLYELKFYRKQEPFLFLINKNIKDQTFTINVINKLNSIVFRKGKMKNIIFINNKIYLFEMNSPSNRISTITKEEDIISKNILIERFWIQAGTTSVPTKICVTTNAGKSAILEKIIIYWKNKK